MRAKLSYNEELTFDVYRPDRFTVVVQSYVIITYSDLPSSFKLCTLKLFEILVLSVFCTLKQFLRAMRLHDFFFTFVIFLPCPCLIDRFD